MPRTRWMPEGRIDRAGAVLPCQWPRPGRYRIMKVIICGAGQVGWQIARHLSGEKNDVTVVDNNADLVRRATDTLDVQGVAGFASHTPTCWSGQAPAMPT